MTDDDKALVSKIRLEAELQKHYDGLLHMQMTLWADRIEALSAENERLREALELADAALRGANMNMNVVQRKICTALGDHHERH